MTDGNATNSDSCVITYDNVCIECEFMLMPQRKTGLLYHPTATNIHAVRPICRWEGMTFKLPTVKLEIVNERQRPD